MGQNEQDLAGWCCYRRSCLPPKASCGRVAPLLTLDRQTIVIQEREELEEKNERIQNTGKEQLSLSEVQAYCSQLLLNLETFCLFESQIFMFLDVIEERMVRRGLR